MLDHLIAVAGQPKDDEAKLLAAQAPGKTLLYFPGSADLPVVVAARISLSFPILISTVPLWQIHHRKDGEPQLRRMVFSDGGISSNFPVHLFDSPLPTRPTFALNLTGFERDEPTDEQTLQTPDKCVRDPAKPNETAVETWKDPARCSSSRSRSKTQWKTGATTPKHGCPVSANASSTSNSAAAKAASTSPWTKPKSND